MGRGKGLPLFIGLPGDANILEEIAEFIHAQRLRTVDQCLARVLRRSLADKLFI